MANHPSRSRQSVEAAMRRLINKHELASISFHVDERGVFAQAYPAPYGTLVQRRREALLGSGDYSLGDVEKVARRAMLPVAVANEKTIEAAASAVARSLASGIDANAPKPPKGEE